MKRLVDKKPRIKVRTLESDYVSNLTRKTECPVKLAAGSVNRRLPPLASTDSVRFYFRQVLSREKTLLNIKTHGQFYKKMKTSLKTKI